MKKFLLSLLALAAMAIPAAAQNYLDIYQGGRLVGSVLTADADSVYVTGDDPASRRIHFASGGRLLRSYLVADVDSIKVFRMDEQPWVYLGILGFNQELYEQPLGILAPSNSSHYTSFVSNLPRRDGTLLYYGVEHALDMLAAFPYRTPYSSVNLITFTDGLDQGSFFMTDRYSTEADYLGALNRRILNDKVQGLPITAYSLGLRGNDVSDYAQFQANLRQLASAADKATEVTSMSDVRNRLQSIADEIISTSNQQTISLKIPGPSNGTQVCFTFDGRTPDQSSLCIEGTFNLSDRSLRNVTYRGIRATTGTTVAGQQQGIFVTYTFTGLQRLDGSGLIPTSYIRQYNRSAASSTWQVNSEFTPANNTQTTITHAGTVILLVLDCSSSLGSQFSDMQSYARDFISRVAQNAANFQLTAPLGLTASLDLEGDDLVVNLSWGAVKYAESYDVYRNNTKIATGITATTWKDTAPVNGSNSYYIVAVAHGLTSQQSSSVQVKKELSAPQNVTASLDDDVMAVHVSWDVVQYAKSYNVYRSIPNSGLLTRIASGIITNEYTDSEPFEGSNNYRYSVEAVCDDLTSSLSTSSSYVYCSLDAPQNVTAMLDDDVMAVHVSWDAVKYAESYEVYRNSISSGTFTKVAEDVTATTWLDENPMNGNNNYYRVVAKGHGLTSTQSQTSNAGSVPLCPNGNHPHMIDLGIGTLWSCCNVGASAPEQYGDYYAWGDTSPKKVYNWRTYVHYDGSSSTYHNIGSNIAGTSYDAATVNWGAPWRLPTFEEINKLLDECTSVWTTYNGVNGRKFTGPNGNSIFLPAAGTRWTGELKYAGSSGFYWSSTLYGVSRAYYLYFYSGGANRVDNSRYECYSVRPVR